MNLISIKKEGSLSAKGVEERKKRHKSKEGKAIRDLLRVRERILRTLFCSKLNDEPLLNTPGRLHYFSRISSVPAVFVFHF